MPRSSSLHGETGRLGPLEDPVHEHRDPSERFYVVPV